MSQVRTIRLTAAQRAKAWRLAALCVQDFAWQEFPFDRRLVEYCEKQIVPALRKRAQKIREAGRR